MGEQQAKSPFGDEFHFLPFISIFGASTIGAVNASAAMTTANVPLKYAIAFFVVWGIVTSILLVLGNRMFDRESFAAAAMSTALRRVGSGAGCVAASLLAVFFTYKTVEAFAGASAPTVQIQIAPKGDVAEPKRQLAGTNSVYFRRTDIAHAPETEPAVDTSLPAPIAPPAKELVGLKAPLPPAGETFTAVDGEEKIVTPEKKVKPAPKVKRVKRVVKKRAAPRPAKKSAQTAQTGKAPVTFSNVNNVSAAASQRRVRGLTSEHNAARDVSGKSAACNQGHKSLSNSRCREFGSISR